MRKLGSGVSTNDMSDLECWRVERGMPAREGRRENVENAGGPVGGGEPGSILAAQAEIAVAVLER